MAQWRGQFTGLSHESKLADAQGTLRTAVAAFRAAGPSEVSAKAKAVRRLAARVLDLRLKMLKARRTALGPVDSASTHAEQLKEPERAALAAGVSGILAEFEATDAHA
ncbi:MAG TPA: hypothetical protein VH092_19770 [Urbifossiella sp.]|jgi:hypothetical protein|nr:hypothetical protein [Urbifossiella sp.]